MTLIPEYKKELFDVLHTPHGSLVTKKNMPGLYILVLVTNEHNGSIPSPEVTKNWGDYVAETLDKVWMK